MPESIVEWKPRPRDRVFIRLSGGRFFIVPQSETLPLKGAVLSDAEIEQLSRADQYFRGKDKALRLLAIRPRTRHEIKKALDGLRLARPIRNGILLELEEQGLIDDRRFTVQYVQSKSETKHLGPHRLRFDLRKLGVALDIVDAVLASEITGESQEAVVWGIIDKKLGGRRADEGDIRRLSGLLRRKGIDYEVINRVMYELLRRSKIETQYEEEHE